MSEMKREIEEIEKRIESFKGKKALEEKCYGDPAWQANQIYTDYVKLSELYSKIGDSKKAKAAEKESNKWHETFVNSEFKGQPDVMKEMLSDSKKASRKK